MKCYGKPIGDIPEFKQQLIDHNSTAFDRSYRLASLYRQQPIRTHCKMCEQSLPDAVSFYRYSVPYYFCHECGHLNGGHQDTSSYANEVYLKQDYGSNYRAISYDDFVRRVKSIYLPKAEFLNKILLSRGENPSSLRISDFGAGSGHFVAALSLCNFHAIGYEISNTQVEFAQRMLTEQFPLAKIQNIAPDEILTTIAQQEAPVVSLIGVLEHLSEPIAFLHKLRENPHIRYLYLSVPLFSLAVYLESAFSDLAPRVLEGGHTHLFTPESLIALEKRFNLERIGEWWFGLDIFDLFRFLSLSISSTNNVQLLPRFQSEMRPLLDSLQEVIDQHKLCSEVHLLYALPRLTKP